MHPLDYSPVFELLEPDKKVVVITHLNPDGDAIGSALGLGFFLRESMHDVQIIIPNDYPEFLAWMPGAGDLKIHTRNARACNALIKNADIIFCVDFNAISRTGNVEGFLKASNAVKILIDHHLEPETESFSHIYSTTIVSSTSELIYNFILSAPKPYLSKEIAEALYTGIMTDTGSFSYACNRPETYHIISHLIECGVDVEKIHRLVYDTYSENRMRLLGFCLSERMMVYHKYSTAYIWLGRDDLKRFKYKIGDTEGVVNYALSIKGIRFAALFTERDNRIRISLRSKGDFSVNDFARNHFEGGGHRNAAGADSFLNLDETLKKFEALLPLYAEKLNHE